MVVLFKSQKLGCRPLPNSLRDPQIQNIFANLTTNERINRGRYPWLVAAPGGPRFNHYDRGACENFVEFLGIRAGFGSGGTVRRLPRDYLEVGKRCFVFEWRVNRC